MDDLSDEERRNANALRKISDYETALTVSLAEEIIKHQEEFQDCESPLHGSAPGILEKYYEPFQSVWTAKKAIDGGGC